MMVLQYFNINDTIVLESIKAISNATTDDRKVSPIIVGGIAIQLYCFSEKSCLLRSTSDIDLMYIPKINGYSEFTDTIGYHFKESLLESGYQVQLQKVKHREKYVVRIMNGQGGKAKELFFLHLDKYLPLTNTKITQIDERQTENSIELNFNNSRIFIPRIEDILPFKIKRIRKNFEIITSDLERSIYKNAEEYKWGELAKISLDPWRDYIIGRQNTITTEKNDAYRIYQSGKDLYDVCLLARCIESSPNLFNRAYYLKSLSEINSLD